MYKIIGVDGKEYGPVALDQLKEWIAAGRVNGQTRTRLEGTTDWKPAAEFPELMALLPPPVPPLGAPRPGSPQAVGPLPASSSRNNGLAITSLVLGIVSFVLCLSALTGIPAIICGHIARRQIRNSPAPQSGSGLALAGLILGYASLLLTLVLLGMLFPALAKAKQRAGSFQCSNHLRQIGLACHMWATDNQDVFPFQVSTNSGGTLELRAAGQDGFDTNTPQHLEVLGPYLQMTSVLICPGDKAKHAAPGFDALTAQNVSYRLRTVPEVALTNTAEVLAACPLHGTVLRCDGSVEMSRPGRRSGP